MLQSCIVERGAKIGAGAIVMEGALVEEYAEVAPGSVVHPGRRIPKGQARAFMAVALRYRFRFLNCAAYGCYCVYLQEWAGNPAVFVRDLSKEELNHREAEAEELADVAKDHAEEFLPVGNVYRKVRWCCSH